MSYVHKGGHGMAMARIQCHVVGHVIQNMRAAEHQPQAAAGRGWHKEYSATVRSIQTPQAPAAAAHTPVV